MGVKQITRDSLDILMDANKMLGLDFSDTLFMILAPVEGQLYSLNDLKIAQAEVGAESQGDIQELVDEETGYVFYGLKGNLKEIKDFTDHAHLVDIEFFMYDD